MTTPPVDSKIRIENENGFEKITFPPPSGGGHFLITRVILPVGIIFIFYVGVIGPLQLILNLN